MIRASNGSGGSGTVVYKDGSKALIFTAHHVIYDPEDFNGKVQVTFTDGRKVNGNVVATEATGNDLAAIVIDAAAARAASGVAPTAPRPGEQVWQLGWTRLEGPFPRSGRIEEKDFVGKYSFDFLVDGGDSGSGAFNAQRQLVAVICWKQAREGPGKALAVDHARVSRFYDACLRNLFGRERPKEQPPQPPQPPAPEPPAPPQTPPEDTFNRLKDRLDGIERHLNEFGKQYGELKRDLTDRLHRAENGVGGALDRLHNVYRWIENAEGYAKLGLGLAGVLSTGGIGGLVVWFLRRRLAARFKPAAVPPASVPPAVATNPAVVTVQRAPLPPEVRRVVDYVPVPTVDKRRVALETAMDELAKRNPGALDMLETVKAYADQIESGMKQKTK
jgi:hypothetical protein